MGDILDGWRFILLLSADEVIELSYGDKHYINFQICV